MEQVAINGFGRIGELSKMSKVVIMEDDIERFKLYKSIIHFSDSSSQKHISYEDDFPQFFKIAKLNKFALPRVDMLNFVDYQANFSTINCNRNKINTKELNLISESLTDSYFVSHHHHAFDWLSTNICETTEAAPNKEAVLYSTSFRDNSRFEEVILPPLKVLFDDIESNLHPISIQEILRYMPSAFESIISIPPIPPGIEVFFDSIESNLHPISKNEILRYISFELQPIDFDRIKKELKRIYTTNRSQVKNIFKRILRGIKNRVKIPQVQNLIAQIVPPRLFHNYIDDTDNNRVAISNFSFSCSCI